MLEHIRCFNTQVSVYPIFRFYSGEDLDESRPIQIRCLVHGEDRKPSARMYPDSNGYYCWVCNQLFTPYNLIKAINPQMTFWDIVNLVKNKWGYALDFSEDHLNLHRPLDRDYNKIYGFLKEVKSSSPDRFAEVYRKYLALNSHLEDTLLLSALHNVIYGGCQEGAKRLQI